MRTAFGIDNRSFFTAHRAIRNSLFLGAMLALSIVTAASQQNHATTAPQGRQGVQPQPPPTVVSANELLAPHKALAAAGRAREALDRGRYDESRKNIERALEIYPTYALAL